MKRATTSLFAQLIQELPRVLFQSVVNKYRSDAHAKGISTWDVLIAMLFAQLAGASSLREIDNEHRDYRVFRDFYFEALKIFDQHIRRHKGRKLSVKFSKPVYSLDSTLITLCLSLSDWAKYRRHKGGIKVHTVLNNDIYCPK